MATTPTDTFTTTSPVVTSPRQQRIKERRITAQLVRQLSEDTLKSPMTPEHVVLEVKNEDSGLIEKKKVYVTEVNGIRTLDLYSGWNPDTQQHKLPLKALPVRCCQLISLERLWVSHNKLQSLPAQLDQLVNLRELFLHRNSFEDIPLSLCSLPRLEILWLNYNKITGIPDDIAKLKTLKRLHLDTNFLKEVPNALCELTSLEVLYLNNNTIHKVSENIGNLKTLRRLHLQQNKITDIPGSICQLTNIETLRLDNNEIRHIPRDFKLYQGEMETRDPRVTFNLKNNPFFTPQSRMKLSVGSMHAPHTGLKTRRFSDQYEQDVIALRRPVRTSQPASHLSSWASESVPMNMALMGRRTSVQSQTHSSKADIQTRPRSSSSRNPLTSSASFDQ